MGTRDGWNFGEFSIHAVGVAGRRDCPTFSATVGVSVGRGSGAKVGGVTARRVVASVHDDVLVW
jgi:hypothetical protein